MKILSKILLVGVVALGGMGSFTTASAHGHGWHGGYYGHGYGYGWNRGYYRQPRVVIGLPPVYAYAPYAYPGYGYYPYYNYPYYGSGVVVIRGGHHHHHHH